MNKKIATWCVVGLFSLGGSTALARVNDSQLGSLLIFPRIDVTPGKTTLVQITNDANRFINIECYWLDARTAKKEVSDFAFQLSRRQTIVFDAATGKASLDTMSVAPFPKTGPRVGELVCWAVEAGIKDKGRNGLIDQISWNYLAGKATVLDLANQDGFEYTAQAFRTYNVKTDTPVGSPGVLDLNDGLDSAGNPAPGYDACPTRLIGQFSPVGAVLPAADKNAAYVANRLTVVSCTQDLRQDRVPVYTKLQWEVYTDDEVGFTGAYACTDSWFQTWLGDKVSDDYASPPPYVGVVDEDGWMSFVAEYIHSNAASYRLESVESSVCGDPASQRKVGLLGLQASWIKLGVPAGWKPTDYLPDGTPTVLPGERIKNTDLSTGANLSRGLTKIDGQILYDPATFKK